jgi:hypothetical protein
MEVSDAATSNQIQIRAGSLVDPIDLSADRHCDLFCDA